MRICFLLLAFILFQNLNGQNLDSHRWKNRVLIVKTQEIPSDKYKAQLEVFKEADASLADRKLVLYMITGGTYRLVDFDDGIKKESDELPISAKQTVLADGNDFEVLLIGLDGGIKLRQTKVLTIGELFNLIDSMPMRRAEIRRRKN